MPGEIKSENINSSFFNGYYKEIWRQIFPEKTTQAEADFIINEAKLVSGTKVLDIMCGYGRHSLELARKGITVTAVDNLPEYINEIAEITSSENLPVNTVCTDVLDLETDDQFDAAICMGNSLQFFNAEDMIRLCSSIAEHLKHGGKFFINTWSLAEIAIRNFKERSWSRYNDLLFLTESKYHLSPAKIETTSIIITDAGEREEKIAIDHIYTIAEMEAILNKSGLQLNEIYSIPGKKQFTLGEPRAYLIAEKNSS